MRASTWGFAGARVYAAGCGDPVGTWAPCEVRFTGLVGEGGVEPPPGLPDTDLNRARLPIPPLARGPSHRNSGLRSAVGRPARGGETRRNPTTDRWPIQPPRGAVDR